MIGTFAQTKEQNSIYKITPARSGRSKWCALRRPILGLLIGPPLHIGADPLQSGQHLRCITTRAAQYQSKRKRRIRCSLVESLPELATTYKLPRAIISDLRTLRYSIPHCPARQPHHESTRRSTANPPRNARQLWRPTAAIPAAAKSRCIKSITER